MSKAQNATVTILRSVRDQDKLIASIANNRRALETQMHQAAVSVLWHVGQHKDVRQIDKLFAVLDDVEGKTSIRTNALIEWLVDFGPVDYDADAKKFSYAKHKRLNLAQAMEKKFWQYAPQKPYEPVDVMKALAAMVKRLEQDATKTQRDHSAVIRALMAAEKAAQAPIAPIEQKAADKLQARKPKATVPLVAAAAPAQLPLQ